MTIFIVLVVMLVLAGASFYVGFKFGFEHAINTAISILDTEIEKRNNAQSEDTECGSGTCTGSCKENI